MSETGEASGRTRPWLVTVLFIAIFLLALLLLRAPLAGWGARAVLEQETGQAVMLQVTKLSLTEATIADLHIGEEFHASDVFIGYSLSALLKGHVDWLTISDASLNASKPDEGLIKRIRDIGGADNPSPETPAVPIPDIHLNNFHILYADPERQGNVKITARLSSDYSLKGTLLAEGKVETEEGAFAAENLVFDFDGNLEEPKINASIKSGFIKDQSETPSFSPLVLRGDIKTTEKDIGFHLKTGLDEELSLLRLEGKYDLDAKTGTAVFDVQDIAFKKNGFQPSSLLPLAENMLPVEGILSSQTQIKWDNRSLEFSSSIDMDEFELIGRGYILTSSELSSDFKGAYNFRTGAHSISLLSHNQKLDILQGNEAFTIEGIDLDLELRDLATELDLNTIRATVVHRSAKPLFVPLVMHMEGKSKGSILSLNGVINDRNDLLSLPFNADVDIAARAAEFSGKFTHKPFQYKGVQPRDLSSLLADLSGKISGGLTADFKGHWQEEQGLRVEELTIDLENMGYRDKDLRLGSVFMTVEAFDIQPAKPIEISLNKITGGVAYQKDSFGIKGENISLNLNEDWKSGNVSWQPLRIRPAKKSAFKQPVFLTGKTEITEKSVTFEMTANNDFLGPFLRINGTHDIGKSEGIAYLKGEEITFEPDGNQLSDFIHMQGEKIELVGAIKAASTIKWSKSGVKSSAMIDVMDLDIASDTASVKGLRGQVKIDELLPLTIKEGQRIEADAIQTAITLDDPEILFRIKTKKGNPVLYLDRFSLQMIGGKADIENAVIDTGRDTNRIDVNLKNLDLEKLMALGEIEDVSASGTLNGRLPIQFEKDTILIDTGFLETAGPGILQLKSESARQALAGGGKQTKLLFDILENFHYSELGIQVKKLATGEDTVTLKTKGANPDVENNRAVILNINIETNLDKLLNTLLDGYLLSEQALRATVRKKQN
ncbi:MAG: YdbH domain-containing protein [Sneathiellales bacterium]|nr:YdbH domain-containing protein [Sneathiellales bacterium]